jgi:hypothetical protein
MYLFSEPYDANHREPEASRETLFEHVARRNGPLEDYNPQMLLQCLLWGAFISSCLTRRYSLTLQRQNRVGKGDHYKSGSGH